MPRQLRKTQAFLELPRHFRKCQISANACDIYKLKNDKILYTNHTWVIQKASLIRKA